MNKGLKILIAVVALSLLLAGVVIAAPTAFDLPWWTVDGGGGTSLTTGNYSLEGTIGQVDASPSLTTSDGQFTLTGGFWSESGSQPTPGTPDKELYLPVIVR